MQRDAVKDPDISHIVTISSPALQNNPPINNKDTSETYFTRSYKPFYIHLQEYYKACDRIFKEKVQPNRSAMQMRSFCRNLEIEEEK